MLGMASHVHVQDTVCVKLFHNIFGCDSNCRDEEFRFGFDDDVDQFVQISSREVDLIAIRSASPSSKTLPLHSHLSFGLSRLLVEGEDQYQKAARGLVKVPFPMIRSGLSSTPPTTPYVP